MNLKIVYKFRNLLSYVKKIKLKMILRDIKIMFKHNKLKYLLHIIFECDDLFIFSKLSNYKLLLIFQNYYKTILISIK